MEGLRPAPSPTHSGHPVGPSGHRGEARPRARPGRFPVKIASDRLTQQTRYAPLTCSTASLLPGRAPQALLVDRSRRAAPGHKPSASGLCSVAAVLGIFKAALPWAPARSSVRVGGRHSPDGPASCPVWGMKGSGGVRARSWPASTRPDRIRRQGGDNSSSDSSLNCTQRIQFAPATLRLCLRDEGDEELHHA
jgi:hypothetical protein